MAQIVDAVGPGDARGPTPRPRAWTSAFRPFVGAAAGGSARRRHTAPGRGRRLAHAAAHAVGAHRGCAGPHRAGSLTNALYNLAGTPGARPAAWLATIREIGPDCPDVATLLKIGQIAAWLAGLARWRARRWPSATSWSRCWWGGCWGWNLLRHCEERLLRRSNPPPLPKIASAQTTGLAMTAILDRLTANPWLTPRRRCTAPAHRVSHDSSWRPTPARSTASAASSSPRRP